MGFSSELRLVSKEENEVIEIHALATETAHETNSFSLEYLFNNVIDGICDINIDISKITVLDLSRCNLTDLPVTCKKLNLKHLGLSHNNLERVPSCLYNGLKYLESLDLSHNKIKNFDIEPDCLPFIKKMKLGGNCFENVPKWFLMFRCINMEEFNYSENKSNNYKFMKNSFNVNFLKLKKLDLISSCLIDNDFPLLKSFKQLEYLDISNSKSRHINRFNDLDELFVKPKWKKLTILKLNGVSLSIFPEGIAWIETLKELHLTDNSLSWLPNDIQYLVNLEVLNVSNNVLVSIPGCTVLMESLKILKASDNCIDCIPDFYTMSNLKTLDLYNNSLDVNVISFNENTVEHVDIELNHCDTNTLLHFSSYEEKKKNLRKNYSFEERYDGPKLEKAEYISDSSSDSDDSYDNSVSIKYYASSTNDESENWDLPEKVCKTNLDIDSEDEMWRGENEENKCKLKNTPTTEKIYVNDEDWMFVDCEDN